MTYTIDKNVPPPQSRGGKFPIKTMDVGDSFVLPDQSQRNNLMSAISNYRKNGGADKKFVTRKIEGGFRIWRIA